MVITAVKALSRCFVINFERSNYSYDITDSKNNLSVHETINQKL